MESFPNFNSFNPGSNFAKNLYRPNKELMLNSVIQQRLIAPATWGQISIAPKYPTDIKMKTLTYIPPFDKSDYWIKNPEGSFVPRTPAPFN